MGTRNLTCVYMDGEYKVAQYGQWDGYPEGQGVTCLNFLRDKMVEAKFRDALDQRSFASRDYVAGAIGAFEKLYYTYKPHFVYSFTATFPEYSRDTAAGILELIMEDRVGSFLDNRIDFAADSLFCEWCYVIDLDKRTFEVYEGFNKEPLTECDRFYFLEEKSYLEYREDDQYHPVRLAKSWSLDELPTEEEFLGAF